MRKILLGTTAVVGAALLTPGVASAQQAPTVRIGGFFQAYYGYTQQTGTAATNVFMNPLGGNDSVATGVNGANPGDSPGSARLGHNDFSSDAEVHVFVNGKTANGLAYGAVIEMAFNQQEAAQRPGARRAVNDKTTAFIDEMYAFVSSPTLGQLRFGDEDGPMGGLMNAGFVTNFGSGGVYGYWENFTVRPNRTTTSPGGLGDNTKIIYLSPQVFGFDVGVSWAFNEGSGEDNGCLNSFSSVNCDRAYAITNPASTGRSHALPGRTNEIQSMLRWRGNIAGVGIAAAGGFLSSQVIRNVDIQGNINKTLNSPQVWTVGIQGSYAGFTLGYNYLSGNTSFFYIPTNRGSKGFEQHFVGASYTFGPVTVGANGFWGSYSAPGSNPNTAFVFNPNLATGTGPSQRRYAFSVGANYRFAPGMDIVAEWTQHSTSQPGVSQQGLGAPSATNVNNTSDRATAQVFLTGVRLAF